MQVSKQTDTNARQGLYTHISAILGECGVGELPNLLSVHLSRATVIFRIGVVGGTAMLTEKRHLCRKNEY